MNPIKNLLAAGFPGIAVCTQEPDRAVRGMSGDERWTYFRWDCNQGIIKNGNPTGEATGPSELMAWLNEQKDTVVFAHNLHLFLNSERFPDVIQAIETGSVIWKSRGNSLVMICPSFPNVVEVEKIFHVIDYPLPTVEELFEMQKRLVEGLDLVDKETGDSITIEPNMETARAARGLTELEAETAFARCISEKRKFDLDMILESKAQTLKKTGFLEFWPPESMSDVGGAGEYKNWLEVVKPVFTDINDTRPQPRGIMQVGVAGGGKSLMAKATASFLGRPLIRVDVPALRGGLVGETEKNMRTMQNVLEAFGPCVAWFDEIEKQIAGGANTASAASDAGTAVAQFGFLLTFLQETKAPILFMATANDVYSLPAPFLRRFEEIFFVDLPCLSERQEIIEIMNRRYGSKLPKSFAETTEGYTGAEIEKVARKSLFVDPELALERVTPVSKMNKEEIDRIRAWAKKNNAQMANTIEKASGTIRKVRVGGV